MSLTSNSSTISTDTVESEPTVISMKINGDLRSNSLTDTLTNKRPTGGLPPTTGHPRSSGTSSAQAPATSTHADLFGIQMEVTNLLLEAERRRLRALQRELETSSPYFSNDTCGKQELEQQQQYIRRMEVQHQQLFWEYQQSALGLLRNAAQQQRSNRSQPAFGVKYAIKNRPTIFGNLANETATRMAAIKQSIRTNGQSRRWNSMGSLTNSTVSQDGSRSSGEFTSDDVTSISPTGSQRSSDQSLIFENSILTSGTLDALIHHVMPGVDYYPDRTYIFAFLLSSRLFIKPYALLHQLFDACTLHKSLYPATIGIESMGIFCRHIVRLISDWTDTFAYDFRDDRMMTSLKDITHFCLTFEPATRKDVTHILHNLLSRLSLLEKYEAQLASIQQEASKKISSNHNPTTDLYTLCPNPAQLAHYLTAIELERLRFIGPEEFVQAFAKESPTVETPLRDMKRTRNLEAYVQWFNRLSYLVATETCMQLKKRHRVRILDYFIEVAKECFNLGNFNSLMAIIAGLNMSPVSRLRKTWAKVNVQKFEILEHQMDPTGNFNSYRSTLKAAMWRSESASTECEKVIIPFFSLLVKDLYFLNEGCASRSKSGHVSFEKFWQLAKQVTQFLAWKQAPIPLDGNNPLVKYLLTNPVFSESALSLASFQCEPPENNYEKTRNKLLKSELSGENTAL